MPIQELTIDPSHSSIEFAATYAMNSIVKGRFRTFSGTISFDSEDLSNASVTVQIDAASVESGDEARDEHLRSADFLDVEVNAALAFASTRLEVLEANHWRIDGNLSIGDQARPVTLDTHYYGMVRDAREMTRAGFVAETDIQRSDWGLTWNEEQETGVLVSDRVRISLYISAIPAESEANQ